MPQTILDIRNYPQSRKCDVPVSNFVTLGGESPTSSDSLKDGFFPNGQTFKNIKGREVVDDRPTLPLSVVKNNGNCPNLLENDLCDLDLKNLLNGDSSGLKNGDLKEDLFSDYLLNTSDKSLKSENMRIKNVSESEILGDFSDLLASISSAKQNSESYSSDPVFSFDVSNANIQGFGKKYVDSLKPSQNESPLSDILSSISFEEKGSEKSDSEVSSWNSSDQEYSESKYNSLSGSNLNGNNFENNGTLSDILSSISFDESEPQKNGRNPSSKNTKNPTLNGLDSVFTNLDSNHPEDRLKQTNKSKNHESLSDMLSSILPSSDRPTDCEVFRIHSDSKSGAKSDPSLDFLVDFDIDNTTQAKDINIPKPCRPNDRKNEDFSFFSVSPENGFSDMLSSISKDVNSQNKEKNNSPGISMLDLFKSVNSDTSSMSEYLSSESSSLDTNAAEVLQNFTKTLDIDLSSCVKTNESILISENSVKKDCSDELEPNLLELKPINFFRKFANTDSTKRPRMNTKQSLFAKALSCKPKKNLVLLQKVENIKSELFEKYFNCPFPPIITSKKDLIENQSNCCMLTFHGRRICTQNGLEDVK